MLRRHFCGNQVHGEGILVDDQGKIVVTIEDLSPLRRDRKLPADHGPGSAFELPAPDHLKVEQLPDQQYKDQRYHRAECDGPAL